ncbi:TolC family protein [Bdellovibrio sp. HCB337]|uniref:TolC family protein n=1 Tax=Bdellovibrio sp. HCB337 TaxID=3394358 RepID=UPI0039A6F58B
MKLKQTTSYGIALLLSAALSGPQAGALTLNEYMNQVKGQNTGYQGTSTQSEGAGLKSREADLYFTPQLFAEARWGHDEKPNSPPVMVYDQLATDNYKLGVSQQFSFGLQSKLYYELNKTNFVGASFGPNVMTEYWDASPKLELSMPLWGGGFGRSARATQEITRQQNFADQYNSGAQANNLLVGAEAAYWRLSAWSEVVVIQEQALKAAQNIHDYVARKQKMNLGEKADVIQAQALLESRTLELQVAKNEAHDALRNFNKFRNQEPYATVENLEKVDFKSLESITVPQARPGDRLDVKATEAQLATAKANSQIVRERNRPTLDVYGTYALNGRDDAMNEAIKNSGTENRDTAFMGVRFNMPLNLKATSDARSGAMKSEKAAELNHQYAQYAQEMDWTTLTRSLTDARDNLKLLGRIEEVQKSKLENERARLRQGRTTTYQVLLFEQDYTQAAVTRVKSAANILGLQSQLKLYETQNSPEGGK